MEKINATLTALTFMLILSVQIHAQNQEARTPILPVQIAIEAPKHINFTELAQWELQHPQPKIRHYIEQGEDRDADFRPVRHEAPADAVSFAVAQNHAKSLLNSPATLTSFNGILDNGTLIPPDIRGAVGATYILETTNQQFNIYTKTGTLQSTLSITTFFSATGGSGYFDPHCVYDPANGRYIIAMDGNVSNGHGGIFVAVSETGDPTGAWYVYSFDGIGNSTDFLDYPLLGYNNNWVVVSGNDFIGGNSPVYAKIYVMNRASLYSGTLGTVSSFTDQNAFCMDPAQTFDVSQNTEYLVQDYNGSSGGNGYMQLATITGSPAAPVYTPGSTIGVNQPWNENPTGAKQAGSTHTLEEGDTRTGNSVYINGSLWFCHTVFLPASSATCSGVDWWQINPSALTVTQYGRIYDGTNFYYYPSIAVNTNGDALLGYCLSSSTTYASAGYAFHAAADAPNTMETGVTYKSGVASYYKTYGGGRNRWGDFSGAAVDPTDNSFWNFSEWANTSNNWGTVIAHIPSSGPVACNAPANPGTSAITASTATFNWSAASGAVSYNLQYRIVGSSTWSTGTSTTTSYNATGLNSGSNYEWQVQTVCSSGSSSFTASTDFTTTTPCNTATGLTTSAITNTSATFGWTAASGAVSYNVQYRVVGTTTWSTGNSTTTSFNVSGLTAGTNYEWQVQTVCSGGSSAFTASSDFTTTGTVCNVPSGLAAGSITSTGASLSWGAVSGASSYNLQWKLSSGSTWTVVTGISTNSYALGGLANCSAYQFEVATVCGSGSSAYSSAGSFSTTGCVLNYCASKGTNTTHEYISKVAIGTINNSSTGDGGYGNFTSQSTNLAGGTSVTITLTPGFHGASRKEYYTVYIDYNHNGVFTDAGELVAETNSKTAVSKSFTVPTTALNGTTRMRIQMQYNAYETNPCASFTYGDVQDYTVNITGNAHEPIDVQPVVTETESIISGMKLYPDPAQDYITLEYNSKVQSTATIQVYNLVGQRVLSFENGATEGFNTQTINTSTFSNGMYIFEIRVNGVATSQKFMISK